MSGMTEEDWAFAYKKLEQENKELRTRVAELLDNHGVAQKSIEVQADCITHDAEKIRNLKAMVAELDKALGEERYNIAAIDAALDGDKVPKDYRGWTPVAQKAVELQNRLSTLEAEARNLAGGITDKDDKILSLLKASEGMEKALEPFATDQGFIESEFETARKALADFRAVKETMKKGAGND